MGDQRVEEARRQAEEERRRRREQGLCIACGQRPIEMGVECGPCYRAGDRRQGIKTY